jgi:hypothetical protein
MKSQLSVKKDGPLFDRVRYRWRIESMINIISMKWKCSIFQSCIFLPYIETSPNDFHNDFMKETSAFGRNQISIRNNEKIDIPWGSSKDCQL